MSAVRDEACMMSGGKASELEAVSERESHLRLRGALLPAGFFSFGGYS